MAKNEHEQRHHLSEITAIDQRYDDRLRPHRPKPDLGLHLPYQGRVLDISEEDAIRSVISCGTGSDQLIKGL